MIKHHKTEYQTSHHVMVWNNYIQYLLTLHWETRSHLKTIAKQNTVVPKWRI